jgi:flagellar basal body-associated protein FliL
MSGEEGGWLWLMIDVVFVVIFAAAMAYGLMAWRKRRNVGEERRRNDATERLYHESEAEADKDARRSNADESARRPIAGQ